MIPIADFLSSEKWIALLLRARTRNVSTYSLATKHLCGNHLGGHPSEAQVASKRGADSNTCFT